MLEAALEWFLALDVPSAGAGFLAGALTGAAGTYLADRYTDVRRAQETRRELDAQWRDIQRRFPAVIEEMRTDFAGPDGSTVRAFFVKSSTTSLGFTSEPAFEYHTDKHPSILAAVRLLEQRGYVSDVTSSSTPMYRVHERLVDRLRS